MPTRRKKIAARGGIHMPSKCLSHHAAAECSREAEYAGFKQRKAAGLRCGTDRSSAVIECQARSDFVLVCIENLHIMPTRAECPS